MKLRNITSLCGFSGALIGAGVGFYHVEYLAKLNQIDLNNWYDQLNYPLVTLIAVLVYIILLMFTASTLCHLPFVLSKKITLKQAIKSIINKQKRTLFIKNKHSK